LVSKADGNWDWVKGASHLKLNWFNNDGFNRALLRGPENDPAEDGWVSLCMAWWQGFPHLAAFAAGVGHIHSSGGFHGQAGQLHIDIFKRHVLC